MSENLNSAEANAAAVAHECGRVVLWIGNEAKDWTPAEYADAGRFARSLGIDSICPKVADGSIKWYGTPERLAEIRAAVLGVGCGFIPFLYSYGPKLSSHQAADEAAVLAEILSVCPIAQCDMEAEWNGHASEAAAFAELMRPVPGMLSVSTWADPNQQDWQGVIHALAPAVNAWTPQQYTNWLAAQEAAGQLTGMGLAIQPGIDLAPEFGADNVASIVAQAIAHGHRTVYLWEWVTAHNKPELARSVVAQMAAAYPESAPAPTPAPTPAPSETPAASPTPGQRYVIEAGDTLSSIAQRAYGNAAHWPTIYNANRAAIGGDPNLIITGHTLEIPADEGHTGVAQLAGPSIIA